MQKTFSKAFKKASEQLAREMDSQLKKNAVSDGWPQDVAHGLSVALDNGSFSTSHNPAHATVVFDMEYGGETASPKGTIRKMHNSTDELTARFASIYEKWLVKL